MSQKNETAVLVLALLITAGLLAGGFWWLTRRGVDLGSTDVYNTNPSNSNSISKPNSGLSSLQPSSDSNFASIKNVPNGLFSYGGSTSWAPIRLIVDPKLEAAQPRFVLSTLR